MSRVRKFLPAERIDDPADAARLILAGVWLIVRGKPMHPGWTRSWPLSLLASTVRAGVVQFAVINPEYTPKTVPADLEDA